MQKHIILSFSITIILLVFLAFISIFKMLELSDLSEKLYHHPFTVTNATKNIQSNIISIQKDMNEIIHSKSQEELNALIREIDKKELLVYEEFKKVFERYLGDKNDIQKSFNAFINWKPIRSEIITLVRKKEYKSVNNIDQSIDEKHIQYLNKQVKILIDYAQNKAIFFHDNTMKSKKETISFILIIVSIILFIIISMFAFLIRNLNRKDKERKKYLYLIDQNIISATLDKNFNFTDVSNAFLRIFGYSKDEFMNISKTIYEKNRDFKRAQVLNILKSGKSWEGEIIVDTNYKKTKWFMSKIVPIFDDNYSIVGFNNILTDISSEKRIEEISQHDALTNIYNRRYFDEVFPKQINTSSRNNILLVFIMLDIDKFKDYNDTYGHQEGDNTLIKVASVLSQTMKRSSDYAFRLGGEEFGLLFNIKNEEDALKIAQDVKQKVEDLKIEHSKNKVSKYITISLGVKVIKPDNKLNIEEIYVSADKALYEAKETGRNKIVKVDN